MVMLNCAGRPYAGKAGSQVAELKTKLIPSEVREGLPTKLIKLLTRDRKLEARTVLPLHNYTINT